MRRMGGQRVKGVALFSFQEGFRPFSGRPSRRSLDRTCPNAQSHFRSPMPSPASRQPILSRARRRPCVPSTEEAPREEPAAAAAASSSRAMECDNCGRICAGVLGLRVHRMKSRVPYEKPGISPHAHWFFLPLERRGEPGGLSSVSRYGGPRVSTSNLTLSFPVNKHLSTHQTKQPASALPAISRQTPTPRRNKNLPRHSTPHLHAIFALHTRSCSATHFTPAHKNSFTDASKQYHTAAHCHHNSCCCDSTFKVE